MTASNFYDSTIFQFLLILTAFLLFIGVGIPNEMTLTAFEETSVFDVSIEWQQYDNVMFLQSLLYIAIMTPAIIGVGLFILQIVRKQRRDVEQPVEYEYR